MCLIFNTETSQLAAVFRCGISCIPNENPMTSAHFPAQICAVEELGGRLGKGPTSALYWEITVTHYGWFFSLPVMLPKIAHPVSDGYLIIAHLGWVNCIPTSLFSLKLLNTKVFLGRESRDASRIVYVCAHRIACLTVQISNYGTLV